MGAFKLGKMTFGSLFKKPETVLYPFQAKPQPQGLKGHIRIDVDACILCGLCERSCTTDCLSVDKQARTWRIDAFGCVQCGYCTTVCPKGCLYMEPDYHPVATAMSAEVFEVPVQGAAAKPAAKKTASESAPEKVGKPAAAPAKEKDAQLEALMGLMSEEASAKVRDALEA